MFGVLSYDPIVNVEVGPLSISPHGVGIAVGFLLGARLMLPAARKRGIDDEVVYSLLTRAAIGALVGARLAFALNHPSSFDSVLDVFKVWEGGISLLGGFAGAILAALPRMRALGLSFWTVMDAAAPGMALGVVIGRIGDLIVADHLGKTTDFFLGYECPAAETASACAGSTTGLSAGAVVHQPALYDLFSAALLLGALLVLRRRPRYDGFLILFFGAWYGTGRIIEDFFRIDETHGTGLTGSQWSSLAVVIVCTIWLLAARRTPGWGRWEQQEERDEYEQPEAEEAGPTMAAPVEAAPASPAPAPVAEPEREEST